MVEAAMAAAAAAMAAAAMAAAAAATVVGTIRTADAPVRWPRVKLAASFILCTEYLVHTRTKVGLPAATTMETKKFPNRGTAVTAVTTAAAAVDNSFTNISYVSKRLSEKCQQLGKL
jgi:hypothetical protein